MTDTCCPDEPNALKERGVRLVIYAIERSHEGKPIAIRTPVLSQGQDHVPLEGLRSRLDQIITWLGAYSLPVGRRTLA